MNRVEEVSHVFQINFVIAPQKQKCLIDALISYSRLPLSDLSVLIGLPFDKVWSVFSGKDFFDGEEALKFVQYFCMIFGE